MKNCKFVFAPNIEEARKYRPADWFDTVIECEKWRRYDDINQHIFIKYPTDEIVDLGLHPALALRESHYE